MIPVSCNRKEFGRGVLVALPLVVGVLIADLLHNQHPAIALGILLAGAAAMGILAYRALTDIGSAKH